MLSLLCSKNPGPPCGVQNPMCPGPCADLSPGPPHGVQRPPHAPGPVWICLVCPMWCTEDPMWPRPCADKSPVPVWYTEDPMWPGPCVDLSPGPCVVCRGPYMARACVNLSWVPRVVYRGPHVSQALCRSVPAPPCGMQRTPRGPGPVWICPCSPVWYAEDPTWPGPV